MLRTILMAAGLAMCILGGQAMVLDHVVLADQTTEALQRRQRFAYANNEYGVGVNEYGTRDYGRVNPLSGQYQGIGSDYQGYTRPAFGSAIPGLSLDGRTFVPPEWSPWGLLTAGVLTFMYANSMSGGGVRRTVVFDDDE